jgi:hypothetical protein
MGRGVDEADGIAKVIGGGGVISRAVGKAKALSRRLFSKTAEEAVLELPHVEDAARAATGVGREASTALGRSIQSLKESIRSGSGPWTRIGRRVEAAKGKAYRGGTSVEEWYRNSETGEELFRHVIERGDEVLHENVRTYSKMDW